MRQVIVTDVRYRTAMAVIRPLARAGFCVIAVQTADESAGKPAAFHSRYLSERIMLDGSAKDEAYADRLFALCEKYDHPILFPIGADTLAMLSRQIERFETICQLLVSPAEVLDAANDKRIVAQTALRVGVPVPREFSGEPDNYPVIIKPRCGEKLGLHAEQRYAQVGSRADFLTAYAQMQVYDPQPIVQEYITGDAVGVCAVMDRHSEPVSVICHRRIREYPISGGPSACCVSIYDDELIRYAVRLLKALHFAGIAMVEFKGRHVLEINPRVWGSFPLTEKTGSRFAENYVRAAAGEPFVLPDSDYRRNRRMRFVLNDTLATISCLRSHRYKAAFSGFVDIFRAREALFCWQDQKPFWCYLFQTIRKRGTQ